MAALILTPIILLWTIAFVLSCEHAAAAISHNVTKFVRPKDELTEQLLRFHKIHRGEEKGGWDEPMADLPLNWENAVATLPRQIQANASDGSKLWIGTYAELQACGLALKAHPAWSEISHDLLTEDWENFSQQRWMRGILDTEYISSHGCFRTYTDASPCCACRASERQAIAKPRVFSRLQVMTRCRQLQR